MKRNKPNNSCVISQLPQLAAENKGVTLFLSRAFPLEPLFSKRSTTLKQGSKDACNQCANCKDVRVYEDAFTSGETGEHDPQRDDMLPSLKDHFADWPLGEMGKHSQMQTKQNRAHP